MLEAKKASSKKVYMDDLTPIDMLKYTLRGLVPITGNGHVYGFALPEHVQQAEAMRAAYDALEDEEA
jgi:hypothetical protein